jgi:hypothetical protein
MATITERFGFTKPAGNDPASIVPLNSNTDLIEQYLGRTQDMIAPLYDDTATYDVGDIVTYESKLYKCITAIATPETFDDTKWEETTAVDEGGGASNVEANPTGTPTDTLNTIGINGTIFGIKGIGIKQLSVTENGTYSEEGIAYSPVIVNVPAPDNAYLLNEVEGLPKDIVTFTDGASLLMPTLKVGIEPQQDLHGQTNPWPAGGGKNLLPLIASEMKQNNGGESSWTGNSRTISGVTFTIQTNNSGDVIGISVNGTASDTISFLIVNNSYSIPSDKTYILNGCPAGGSSSSGYSMQGSGGAPYDVGTGSSEFSTITGGGIRIRIGSGTVCNNLLFKPMIRLASESDATFAPYENICPISGHTEANVTRTGVNLWDEQWEHGIFDNTTGEKLPNNSNSRTKNMTKVSPNTQYAIIEPDAMRLFFYAEDKSFISTMVVPTNNNIITTPNNCHYINFQYSGPSYNNDRGINYPSTDTEYHAYQGQTYTTALGRTVYGGTLDVVSGELKVVPYYASYNGETLEGEWISDRDVYAVGTTPTIGAQVVNIGATPTTYQLTPTQVKSLLGTNNVWADTGDIEELEYFSKEA